MLTTASVTMSCIIEKPRWAVGFFFRLVRVLITPPVREQGGFRQNFPWSMVQRPCQPRIARKCLGFLRVFNGDGGLVVTESNAHRKSVTHRARNDFCGIRRDYAFK